MRLGHVLGDGGVAALERGAHGGWRRARRGAALDGVGGVAQHQLLAHQAVGHRVVVALELDVVVDVHAHRLPLANT